MNIECNVENLLSNKKFGTQKDAAFQTAFNVLTFRLQSVNLLVSIRINIECDETIISSSIVR